MSARSRLLIVIIVLVVLAIGADQWRRMRIESRHDAAIVAASRRHRVDPALVKGIIWRESRFDAGARGSKGEIGLMQIMPKSAGAEWASAFRRTNYSPLVLVNPAENVDCGAWYLGKLLARYRAVDDPIPYALADYNAGRSNALRWMQGAGATNSAEFVRQISFGSTQRYVRAIMKRKARYDRWAAQQLQRAD